MDVRFYFSNQQKKKRVGLFFTPLLVKTLCTALACENVQFPCSISVTFTDNEGIRKLNREYRNKDSVTDVLSFPMYDFHAGEQPLPGQRAELGDIVLSLERAEEQAKELGHSFAREAAFLCIHSLLHLLGYDHERSAEDEEEMCLRQRDILNVIRRENCPKKKMLGKGE